MERPTDSGLLSLWFAEPLSLGDAAQLKHRAQQRRRRAIQRGHFSRVAVLMEMIALFWLEEESEPQLHPKDHSPRFVALEQLICGQLMISRRLPGAINHLDRGFTLAVPLLSAAGYLVVMQRHQGLKQLPQTTTPLPAASLAQLSNTAGVIERLRETMSRPQISHDPTDIYG